jgi:hypothetical protein
MRTMMMFALTLFAVTACAVSEDDRDRAIAHTSAEADVDSDVADPRDRCSDNAQCPSLACDVITSRCVPVEELEDDTTRPDPLMNDVGGSPQVGTSSPPPRRWSPELATQIEPSIER